MDRWIIDYELWIDGLAMDMDMDLIDLNLGSVGEGV